MRDAIRRLILASCAVFALVLFVGCAEHEHRKVRVIEEQHEGEVHEQGGNEKMIVE